MFSINTIVAIYYKTANYFRISSKLINNKDAVHKVPSTWPIFEKEIFVNNLCISLSIYKIFLKKKVHCINLLSPNVFWSYMVCILFRGLHANREDTNHLGVLVFPQTPEHTEGFEDQKFEEKKCLWHSNRKYDIRDSVFLELLFI